jgi:hypothetical protein
VARKRTKAQYARLFDDPSTLFGKGTKVLLYPNGEPEIWIQNALGQGFRITANNGPAGFGVTVSQFAGSPVATLAAMCNSEPINADIDGIAAVSLTQYNSDEWSQQFKKWYQGESEYPGLKPVED